MLLLAVIIITYIRMLACVMPERARPIPHAEVLDELLSKYLGDSYSNSALFEFILGDAKPDRNSSFDDLDISILDVDTVKKIVKFAKQKYARSIERVEKTRRTRRHQLFDNDTYVVNRSLAMMQQTIYMTKERINLTRPFRKYYSEQSSYKIALLYGAAAAILGKMEALLSQAKKFPWKTQFLWYLIIYEKILACNIDISDSIEKLFIVQGEYEVIRGAKKTAPKKITFSESELALIKANPGMKAGLIAQKEKEEREKN